MSSNTMTLCLIQDPSTAFPDDGNAKEHVRNMKKYFKGSIYIKNIFEFICQVQVQVATREKLIKKLIIGGHGTGWYNRDLDKTYGFFEIGSTKLSADDKDINHLKRIAHCFVKNADVYIVSCKVGHATALLQQVSAALGGIRVHSYTDYIVTADYGPFGVSFDDGTDDEGDEIVCLPGDCSRKIKKPRIQLM